MPRSSTPAGLVHQAPTVHSCCLPSARLRRHPPLRRFRGSITRPARSLSTLRPSARAPTRKTRFRLVANLCRVGLITHWVPHAISRPLPCSRSHATRLRLAHQARFSKAARSSQPRVLSKVRGKRQSGFSTWSPCATGWGSATQPPISDARCSSPPASYAVCVVENLFTCPRLPACWPAPGARPGSAQAALAWGQASKCSPVSQRRRSRIAILRASATLELSRFSGQVQAWAEPSPERGVFHTGLARHSRSPSDADAGCTSPR